jgi:hypothetical protein
MLKNTTRSFRPCILFSVFLPMLRLHNITSGPRITPLLRLLLTGIPFSRPMRGLRNPSALSLVVHLSFNSPIHYLLLLLLSIFILEFPSLLYISSFLAISESVASADPTTVCWGLAVGGCGTWDRCRSTGIPQLELITAHISTSPSVVWCQDHGCFYTWIVCLLERILLS